MSDSGPGSSYPPPGQVPPPAPPPPGWSTPPGYSQPPPYATGPVPAPWLRGAAHKPGAVPLRPLGLSDIYDAAFRIIRFNPKATVGAALLVAAVSMAIPLVVTAILTATSDLALSAGDGASGADVAAVVGTIGSYGVGAVLQAVGSLLVTGLIVHVTLAAALGRKLSLGEAWAATRGRRLRLVLLALAVFALFLLPLLLYVLLWVLVVLIGVTALTVVWGVVTVPSFLALLVWLYVRLAYLPVPVLMAERTGVRAAFSRAFTLTRRQFWRTFGIALLTLLITGVASQVLTTPLGLVASLLITGLGPQYELLGLVVVQALTTVISAAFVTPFTAAVTSLQYVDQRMRKEAYDVELMQQAGVTAA